MRWRPPRRARAPPPDRRLSRIPARVLDPDMPAPRRSDAGRARRRRARPDRARAPRRGRGGAARRPARARKPPATAATVARAQEGLGSIAVRRGKTAAAIEWFERVLETAGRPDPAERIELYRALGQAYSESGRSGPAIALFEECLAELEQRPGRRPGHARPLLDLPVARLRRRRRLRPGGGGAGGRPAARRRGHRPAGARFAYHALARLYCTTGTPPRRWSTPTSRSS